MKPFYYTGPDKCRLTAWEAGTNNDHLTVLLHGGGPDHHSLVPLAKRISGVTDVVLPDIRGYGQSVCRQPYCHTWSQYVEDVISLLDRLVVQMAIICGTGLGATIALRFAAAYPNRTEAIIPISIEEIEDDASKQEEIRFMDAFAERVLNQGIMAGWEPILDDLAPLIRTLVEDAIPRSDPESIAAAASIGRDRSFRSVEELEKIRAKTLIIPGMDQRHPAKLAHQLGEIMPDALLAQTTLTEEIRTAENFAEAFAPEIIRFIKTLGYVFSSSHLAARDISAYFENIEFSL